MPAGGRQRASLRAVASFRFPSRPFLIAVRIVSSRESQFDFPTPSNLA